MSSQAFLSELTRRATETLYDGSGSPSNLIVITPKQAKLHFDVDDMHVFTFRSFVVACFEEATAIPYSNFTVDLRNFSALPY